MTERGAGLINRRDTLALIGALPLITAARGAAAEPTGAAQSRLRQRLPLDDGWKFHLGDADDLDRDFQFGANQRTYAKQGVAVATTAASNFTDMQWGKSTFDDSDWTDVILPHDWAAALPFTPNARFHPTKPDAEDPRNGHGFKPLGREYPATSIGWYRRKITLAPADAGKRLSLEFDGVFRDALIMVNGYILLRNESGYAPFSVDFTDVANTGGENLITIRVDATLGEGWFYEGAGIYRRVWLVKTAPLHVPQWGVWVRADGHGAVEVATELRLDADASADAVVTTAILDPDGRPVTQDRVASSPLTAWTGATLRQSLRVPAPKLWDVDHPHLYTLRTTVEVAGRPVDEVQTRFGFRDIRFDADTGFYLNGRPLKLHGANLHQDHAGVGVAVTAPLNRFRLERMVEMGCNAIRTSHGPASAEFMDLCDELGLMVLAENREMSSSPEALDQLERLVRRDRNRPSVILWSIGNEEPQEASVRGARIVHTQMRTVRRLDPTRLIGAAFDNSFTKLTGMAPELDFIGVNYNAPELAHVHQTFPHKIVVGTEGGSSVATRGVYQRDDAARHVSAYDTEKPPWGQLAQDWLPDVETKPYVAGGFVWTGIDYHGEPTPYYTWPSVGSQFGLYDLCGFPKDTAYYVRAWWRPQTPLLHLFPHWTWPGREGQTIQVWCYSNLDEVELSLNGRSLGRQPVVRFGHAGWAVPYAAGRLEAVGYRRGQPVLRQHHETTGAAVALRLSAERRRIRADGQDMAIVTLSCIDAQGRPCPTADQKIDLSLLGPLWIAGVGNGDPSSHAPEQASGARLFNGLAQALLRTRPANPGAAGLSVRAPGLKGADISFDLV